MDETPPQTAQHAADWYPDPLGRAEMRYFDGTAWTDHISTAGEQQVDPFGTDKSMTEGIVDYALTGANATKFTFNTPQWEGTGHLCTEPVLLVEQQGSWVQTAANYDVKSHAGTPLGSVRQVGQSQAKQLVRAFSSFDKHMTHRFEVLDAQGGVIMALTRPAKMMKSKVIVEDPAGNEIGRIVQENTFGKIRFALEAGGQKVGQITGKSWSDWDFVIADAQGEEVGRVTKSFAGIAKAMLQGADNYVVAMHRPLEDPLRMLVVASGVCIDTALHMDDKGIRLR
jgi:uncharacterized protein YxjI